MKLTETQRRVMEYLYENYEGRYLNLSYAMSAITLADRGWVSYSYDGRRKRWHLTYTGRAAWREERGRL